MNREFIHGAAETLTPGVYRKGQNRVANFAPPDQGDVPVLMRAFVEWIQTADLHPVLKAGIAHVHFVAIHPFWDGNGRTARGLDTLILQRSAFHFKKLLSMEARLLSVRQPYFDALGRTLGTTFGAYDATPWLDFYVRTLADEVRGLVSTLSEWHRGIEEVHSISHEVGILDRQADALAFVLHAKEITRSDYVEIMRVSAVTASRDLKDLVEKGLLLAEGNTSSRVYRPSSRLRRSIE
jgi:Fic family protein